MSFAWKLSIICVRFASVLCQCVQCISESLDFDAVLQNVLDSACSLTGARYGVLTLLDETGQADDFLSSGMTSQEAQGLWDLPDALKLFEHLGNIPEPLRLPDLCVSGLGGWEPGRSISSLGRRGRTATSKVSTGS